MWLFVIILTAFQYYTDIDQQNEDKSDTHFIKVNAWMDQNEFYVPRQMLLTYHKVYFGANKKSCHQTNIANRSLNASRHASFKDTFSTSMSATDSRLFDATFVKDRTWLASIHQFPQQNLRISKRPLWNTSGISVMCTIWTMAMKGCWKLIGIRGSHLTDLSCKSHNAPIIYPTMHHFVTEMCTCVHISVTKWCIVGYISDALWDLWDDTSLCLMLMSSTHQIPVPYIYGIRICLSLCRQMALHLTILSHHQTQCWLQRYISRA